MKGKVDKLEKLCRALQTERKTLRQQLQEEKVIAFESVFGVKQAYPYCQTKFSK